MSDAPDAVRRRCIAPRDRPSDACHRRRHVARLPCSCEASRRTSASKSAILGRLDEVLTADSERGRAALRDLRKRITLQPDGSGRFPWAEYSLGIAPLLLGAGASADLMVAGAGFEPATLGL